MRRAARQASERKPRVAGRVGDDAGGRLLLSHLAAHGVRAEIGIDATAPTGTVLVVDGEIRADRGANSRYEPQHLPALEADVVLISGHLPEATVAAALGQAQARWVALDAARLTTVPDGVAVVLANEAAARQITGAGARGGGAAAGPRTPARVRHARRGRRGRRLGRPDPPLGAAVAGRERRCSRSR